MMQFFGIRFLGSGAGALWLMLVAGCSALTPSKPPTSAFYALSALNAPAPQARTPAGATGKAPTLIVNPPHAAPGFDSQRIIYVRDPHKLEYFAHSEWVDAPARMVGPILVDALTRTGAFRAVVLTPTAAVGDLLLDTEMLRLVQDFSSVPSQVRFTVRVNLLDNTSRQVLAWREFDATAVAPSDDPYGGVVAANVVVQGALEKVAAFCAESSATWVATPVH